MGLPLSDRLVTLRSDRKPTWWTSDITAPGSQSSAELEALEMGGVSRGADLISSL